MYKTLKTVAVMAIGIFTANSIQAQKTNVGMNLRFNQGSMSDKTPFYIPTGSHELQYSVDQAAGVEIGAFAELKFNRHIALQPELNIGFTTLIVERNDKAGSVEWTSGAFSIPVLFKYKYGGLAVMTGPMANVTLYSSAEGKGLLFNNTQFPATSKGEFNSLAWSAVFGIEYTTRRPGVGVHLRYAAGLTPVWKNPPYPFAGSIYETRDSKISALQFGLHWRFGKDKTRV